MFHKLVELIFAHGVFDAGLQTYYIASHKSPLSGEGWFWVLLAHSVINGAGVYLVTRNIWLGIAETIAHFFIDLGSSSKTYSLTVDQGLHFTTKLVWAYYACRT